MKKLLLLLCALGVTIGANASITSSADGKTVTIENFTPSDLTDANKDILRDAETAIFKGTINNQNNAFTNDFANQFSFKNVDLTDLNISILDDTKTAFCKICSGSGSTLKTPAALTEVGQQFKEIKAEKIIFNQSVTKIGSQAFMHNHNIKELFIDKNIETIEGGAFFGCSGLTDVVFASGLENVEIGGDNDQYNGVFQNCEGLKHVTIPEGVTKIGNSAFYDCKNLESVHFPSTLLTIGDYSFDLCEQMSQLVIPKNVETIGKAAFQNSGLRDIYVMQTDTTKLPKIYPCSSVGDQNGTFLGTEHLGTNFDLRTVVQQQGTKEKILDYIRDLSHNIKTVILHYPNTPELRAFYDYNPWYKEDNFHNDASGQDVAQGDKKNKFYLSDTYGIKASDGSLWPQNQTPNAGYDYPPYLNDMQRRIQAGKDKDGNYTLSSHGWRQLVVQGTFSPSEVIEKNIDDTWYTFCPPYDVNDEQLAIAFNEGFNIAEFDAARIMTVNNEDALVFFFTKVAKAKKTYRDGKVLARGGHPYMIHPNIGVDPGAERKPVYLAMTMLSPVGDGTFDPSTNSVKVDLMDAREATKSVEGTWTDEDGVEYKEVVYNGESLVKKDAFVFIGNTTKDNEPIGAGNYFLGCGRDNGYNDQYYPQFYKETSDVIKGSGETAGGRWTKYTAIIKPAEGVEDMLNSMLNKSNSSKKADLNFEDNLISTPTAIKEILNEAREQNQPVKYMPVVYNINGQVVRTDSINLDGLPTGLYIVKGKKYFVK